MLRNLAPHISYLMKIRPLLASAALLIPLAAALAAGLGYQDTPKYPGSKWHVHDGERPQPKVITPGEFSTKDKPGTPPSDAVVLFDGKDLSKWKHGDGEAKWKVENGYFEVVKDTGYMLTKENFGPDMQLHIEFATPSVVVGDGQGRGNSGVFFYGPNVYEIQILDSYNNPTYPDGQATAIYGQTPPLVNASRKPGEWQVYDIIFEGPRFKEGKLERPAFATVLHNGVITQNHTELLGPTLHRQVGVYAPHPEKGPIALQDHGNPMRFRNIWIRELKPVDSQ
jgi:hypothetical protein